MLGSSSTMSFAPADSPLDDLVRLLQDEKLLVDADVRFAQQGFCTGDRVAVIATSDYLGTFQRRLDGEGCDLAAEERHGRFVRVDAHDLLSRIMRDGVPEPRLFEAEIGRLFDASPMGSKGRGVRLCGDMAAVLWRQGKRGAAILLEELCSEFGGRREPFVLRSYGTPAEVPPAGREPSHSDGAALHRAESQQLQLIADALPSLVSYVDTEQRYRFASAAYERWFAFPPGYVVGKHLREIVGVDGYDRILPYAERALRGEEVTFEAEIPYPHGGARFIEGTYVPHESADGTVHGFIALVTDISERKVFDRSREHAANRITRFSKITAAIAEAVTSEEVFVALVDRVHEALAATSAALWLVDDETQTARLMRAIGYSAHARRQIETIPLHASLPIPALDAMRCGEAIWIESQAELVRLYPHIEPLVSPDRDYAVCCLPLVARGKVLGGVALTLPEVGDKDDEAQALLLLAARYASQAVERLRLFDAERRARNEADATAHRMGVLSRASRAFVETDLELGPRIEAIVSELGTSLESCVGINLLEEDGLLHGRAAYHPDAKAGALLKEVMARSPLRLGEGVTGVVAATRKSQMIANLDPVELLDRVAPAYRAFLERHPSYAMICAPLRSRGQVIGTVTTTRTRPGETYTAADLDLVEQLAERAAAAIENAQLFQENVNGRRRAEHLYKFAAAVVAADKVETVLDAALDGIHAALGVTRSSVLTLDRTGVMRFVAWRGLSEAYRAAVEGHSPWPADATSPEPVLVPDVKNDPAMSPYGPLFEREGIGALAFIPLVARRRLLGQFMVYYDEPHSFASHEVGTARAIANHLGSVIARFAAVSRLEDTIRANELFAGVLAHDLLNPLAAIMNGAQLLLMHRKGEAGMDGPEVKAVSRIIGSGQRMQRMIEQLLDFTRARTGGGIEVQPRPINLVQLCAQALGELQVAYPAWKIRTESNGDLTGSWDGDRLMQIVSNLVANAGAHGRPDEEILLRLDGKATNEVRVEVRNVGTISPEVLPHLFDPFRTTRVGRQRSRGLGLGLFIVREIVRAHGGAIDVSSGNESTAFVVRLPRRNTQSQ